MYSHKNISLIGHTLKIIEGKPNQIEILNNRLRPGYKFIELEDLEEGLVKNTQNKCEMHNMQEVI